MQWNCEAYSTHVNVTNKRYDKVVINTYVYMYNFTTGAVIEFTHNKFFMRAYVQWL